MELADVSSQGRGLKLHRFGGLVGSGGPPELLLPLAYLRCCVGNGHMACRELKEEAALDAPGCPQELPTGLSWAPEPGWPRVGVRSRRREDLY